MKNVLAWFARNPVAANLVMIVLLAGGVLTSLHIKRELFPEFSLGMISVSVVYPGAAPEEVEEAICVRIEEEVHALDGVKRVTSTAGEGVGTVMVEVLEDADVRKVLDDVTTRVNSISTFPELAERPIVQELLMRSPVINVALSGDVEEHALKHLGERLRDDISALDGVSQVELTSTRPYEISIELSEEALRRHGLTFDAVAQAVRRGSLDLSGGSLKTASGEVLVRTKGQAYRGADFAELVVLTRDDGSRVLLRDVATVLDGFEDTDASSHLNGQRAVQIQVFRVGEEDALKVAEAVHAYVERERDRLPAGVAMTVNSDRSVLLRSRFDLLVHNGAQGLALVFLVLALFLRFRLAAWVTMGIPISFMGAMWLMPELDVTVNMLSLFGFILVLGIVVDDAIVVGESIFTEQKKGGSQLEAAIVGAEKVAVPVTFAILTTIAAFAPLLGLPGMFGKFFRVIPSVVIPILVFSWVESKIILPAHLGHGGQLAERLGKLPPFSWWVAFQGLFERGLLAFAERVYRPTLDVCLRWRYLTHAVVISTLLVVVGLVAGKHVRMLPFPAVDGDIVSAQLTLPLGTPAEVTEAAVARLEAAALRVRDELEASAGREIVRHSITSVGSQPFRAAQENRGLPGQNGASSGHLGEVVLELIPSEEREDVPTAEVLSRWREAAGPIAGAVELVYSSSIMAGSSDLNIEFRGRDLAALRAAADELKLELGRLPGVYDVSDSFRGGKQELRLDLLPAGEALGLTLADVARQARQGFYGEEAQRVQRGRDEVKVMVRYPDADRRTLHTLETMRVRTPAGDAVPLESIASVTPARSYATIQRADRQRIITVSAETDTNSTSSTEVLNELAREALPAIVARHPSVTWSVQGQTMELGVTLEAMQRDFVIALLLIYALLAVPFRSYIQPVIVMSAIPLGLVGAVIGHVLMGHSLSMLSIMGFVALSGVVVNDSLVMVDYINGHRAEHGTLLKTVREAGVRRFRPILLTSLTTFAGLTPLMFEKSVQAQFLIPMAIALAWGVMFSTVVTLIFVPAGYIILDDVQRAWRWLTSSATWAETAEQELPAASEG
ncbi:MAG: efflux RND transporter permease subunit [Planctomycetes bacterium]|nr:efflux RND transporter permease subunit [Planctomycetota bacterium]